MYYSKTNPYSYVKSYLHWQCACERISQIERQIYGGISTKKKAVFISIINILSALVALNYNQTSAQRDRNKNVTVVVRSML